MSSRRFTGALGLLLVLLVAATSANADSPDVVADLLARINQERTSRGLVPYALSAQLSAAAQAHASDIAKSGKYGHTGSDGSSVFDRVARAGYGAYSWGRRVGENYAVYRDVQAAMTFWMASAPHRENILHTVYREIGIGVAPSPKYGGNVYVLNFGAQPNVLPFFINDGAGSTSSSNVTLRLDDEQVFDTGTTNIAKVKQVQVSNDPSFADATWQPYSAKIPWTLAAGTGTRTVYVKYRDPQGRTATSSDSIAVGTTAASVNNIQLPTKTATLKPAATRTRKPTSTATRTPRPTATLTLTPEPTDTEEPTPTDSLPEPTPEITARAASVSVAYRQEAGGAPAAATAAPLPPASREKLTAGALSVTDPLAFALVTIGIALGGFSAAKYYSTHNK